MPMPLGNTFLRATAEHVWRKARPRLLGYVHDYYCQHKDVPSEPELWHARVFELESENMVSLADVVCVYEKFFDETEAGLIENNLNLKIAGLLEETEENIA